MHFVAIFLSILAISPAAFAAPIAPAHYQELEARWHLSDKQKQGLKSFGKGFMGTVKKVAPIALAVAPMIIKREEEEELHRRSPADYQELEARWHLSDKQKQDLKSFGKGFMGTVKKVAPIALSVAPLIIKREEEEELYRRAISEKAKNLWTKVGNGAQKTWEVMAPKLAEMAAKQAKLIDKRDESSPEFVERDEIPSELFERDILPEALYPRDFEEMELERRAPISDKAKNFWKKVGHGAEKGFEQFGPLAFDIGVTAITKGRSNGHA